MRIYYCFTSDNRIVSVKAKTAQIARVTVESWLHVSVLSVE